MNIVIRSETAADEGAIRAVNMAAFGTTEEADIVEALRTEGAVLGSLVAVLDDRVVGHVMFSRMWIDTVNGSVAAVALAPMSVLPEYQRRGFGAELIRRGITHMRASGERIMLVVGHPSYYPRFGFSSDAARDLDSPFPRDAFMALELTPGGLNGVAGRVRYPQAFGI